MSIVRRNKKHLEEIEKLRTRYPVSDAVRGKARVTGTHDSSIQAKNLKHSKLRDFKGMNDPSKERLVCMGFMWRESCVARADLRDSGG